MIHPLTLKIPFVYVSVRASSLYVRMLFDIISWQIDLISIYVFIGAASLPQRASTSCWTSQELTVQWTTSTNKRKKIEYKIQRHKTVSLNREINHGVCEYLL